MAQNIDSGAVSFLDQLLQLGLIVANDNLAKIPVNNLIVR
jgi:hypothetical protein